MVTSLDDSRESPSSNHNFAMEDPLVDDGFLVMATNPVMGFPSIFDHGKVYGKIFKWL